MLSSGTGNKLTDSGLSVQKMGLKKIMQIFIQEKKDHQFCEGNPFSSNNYKTQKNICILVNPQPLSWKNPALNVPTYNPFKNKDKTPQVSCNITKNY